LKKKNLLHSGTFDYGQLQIHSDYVTYEGHHARNIVFAEGYGLTKNPFFNYLPMQGSKGEYLVIEANDLQEDSIIKSSIFLIPLGNNLYKVGATYNRNQKDNQTTNEAKSELLKKLDSLLDCPYTIVDQLAGVRPTVKDRRPLVGNHPTHKNFWVLNGFGSHGIMIGPWASLALFNRIEFGEPILKEMDIDRFGQD
jgi:glycine/D-amino acid oxidase-like deaminating enzyme